jgi:hypothetical protein
MTNSREPVLKKEGDKSNVTEAHGGEVHISDRTSLYVAILAFGLAAMSLGGEVVRIVYDSVVRSRDDQLIDAKLVAAVAKSEAESNAAKVNARVAIDKLEEVRIQLARKGIVTKIE